MIATAKKVCIKINEDKKRSKKIKTGARATHAPPPRATEHNWCWLPGLRCRPPTPRSAPLPPHLTPTTPPHLFRPTSHSTLNTIILLSPSSPSFAVQKLLCPRRSILWVPLPNVTFMPRESCRFWLGDEKENNSGMLWKETSRRFLDRHNKLIYINNWLYPTRIFEMGWQAYFEYFLIDNTIMVCWLIACLWWES